MMAPPTRYRLLIALLLLVACAPTLAWSPPAGHVQVPIWPGRPPDSQVTGPEGEPKSPGIVTDVSVPTMTLYRPQGKSTGTAIVVFPGGGYKVLAMDLEGTEVCEWLAAHGITGVLLKYRVPSWPYPKSRLPLEDAMRTIRLVRARAAEWHLDPHKIGVLGFSAGAHLAVAASTNFAQRVYRPVDATDRIGCRPDFAVVLYPGHLASRWDRNFVEQHAHSLNPRIHIPRSTPPTFLLQAEDDPVDSVENSLVYYAALKKAAVPAEMHLYAHGGHAFGSRRTKQAITEWPGLMERWLRTIGKR
jgi:acetyl esterase/lipase